MAEEEFEMADENLNYEILAQIYTIINDKISQKSIAMEKVLQKDFDINYRVPKSKCSLSHIVGRTALDFALDKGESEIFKMLIKRGADFTDKDQNGTTILHRIIKKSHVIKKQCYELMGKLEHPFVQSVLSAHVELNKVANPHDRNGISHFHVACMFDHTQAVQYFLRQGVSVNQTINQDSTILPGYTPLHLAARYSAFETAKILLGHNANFELKDAQGTHPLQLLVQRNMEISDWKNVQKQTLCDQLKEELFINEQIIKLLLETIGYKEEGLSRCQIACTLQDIQVLEQTLTEGANLNASVSENSPFWPGYTALHFAAIFNINAVRLLLANGANVLAKDSNGVTPLDLCLQRYSPEIIHSIMSIVAELNEVKFLNTNTKLCDLVLAMSDADSLKTFIQETMKNVNATVPFDSPIWPGYTILHIATALSDRNYENKDPHKDTDYKQDRIGKWSYYPEAEYIKRIKLCLSMGADVTITDVHNSSPLHLAFRLQNKNIVELLLEHHHKVVDVVDDVNLSHLDIACAVDQRKVVEKLLESGADINLPVKSSFDFQLSTYEIDSPQILHFNPGLTCLHIGMATWNEVETLIEHGADLYARDSYGLTPIHHIPRLGCWIFEFNLWLPKCVEDRTTSFGFTHLHVACFIGDFEAVKELLERGADIEARINCNEICSAPAMTFLAPFDGYTPFHFALKRRTLRIVKLLVQRGADIFAKAAGGIIPLYEALKIAFKPDDADDHESYFYPDEELSDDLEYGNFDDKNETTFALDLLSDKQIKKLVEEHSGLTKLHIACLAIKTRQVSKLLKTGADPNARINVDSPIWPGYTPLHVLMIPRFKDDDNHECQYQIYSQIEKNGRLLLESGACVTLKDAEGNTPIHMAPELMWSDSKLTDIGLFSVGWILEGISDFTVNPINAEGISHFDVACMTGQSKVVEKFLKQGVDVNRRLGHFSDRYGGFTPLHLATLYKDECVVHYLLEHGANLHAKDFLGNTPLHSAAVYCRLGNNGYRPYNDAVYISLLKAGANTEAKNLWNEPPLAVALRMGLFTDDCLDIMLENNRTRRINLFNLENEEGLLGMALRYRSRIFRIEEHCFFKIIVNFPDLNGADEMGRTVIHNVVSVNKPLSDHWKNGSIKDYADVINEFIKLDFDIDFRDIKGQTALHKAACFGNYNAIIGLLMNGADINIVDNNNKPAFAYSIERKEDTGGMRRNILQACLLHVYKLQVAGLEISNANQEIVAQIRKESISCPNEMQSCIKELENLKKHTIANSYSVTMYNFLSEMTTYFRMMLFLRDTIRSIFVKNATSLREKYPYFAGLLQMQYRNIFIRSQLHGPAKISLSILAGFEIPDLCSDKILKSLNNKDLKQVITATDSQ